MTAIAEDPVVYKFERRQSARWPTQGQATLFRLDSMRFGDMVELSVQDYSHGGFGGVSQEPLEPGTLVSVGFSMPGTVARRGIIVSCRPCGHGYRVGMRFEQRMAA
ncbi:MAG: PilZ domain-containing protein [Planctomycetota bacterium]